MSGELGHALVAWKIPQSDRPVVRTTHQIRELTWMPLRHPNRLLVLLPRLQNCTTFHIKSLDRTAVSSCHQNSSIAPYVSRMRNIVDIEPRDGLNHFPRLGRENLYARPGGHGE